MSVATHLVALVAYALLTVLLTYPIAFRLGTEVPGGGDAWQHIWNLWWVKQALLVQHTNPYFTDLLYYPTGVNLYFHTLVLTAGLEGIPLQLAGLNLIATYNIVLLLTFVLAGYGAFLLCYYLTGNRWASFVGGLVFAFSPYHFAHLFGHMNLASLQWIPFYVLLLLKAVDAPGQQRHSLNGHGRIEARLDGRLGLYYAAGAGALLAVNTYTDLLYGIFLVMLTALVIGWRLLAPSERLAFALRGVSWADGLLRLALGGLLFLLLVSPILFPTLAEARRGYAQQPPAEVLFYSSDLYQAFIPSQLHPFWGKSVAAADPLPNPSEKIVFLGYTVLALGLYAAWRLRANRRVRAWGFTAVASWLLSLGPVLQAGGKTQFTAFGVTVPLPYLLLYKLPLLSIMRTPARLTVLTMLALAVLAAFATADILGRLAPTAGNLRFALRRPAYGLTAVLIPALILFEFLAIPFPTVPPGWGVPIYAKIAQEPGRFALLELPIRPFGDYMAYQTIHGKPIIGGYLSRQPPYPLLDQVPALKYLQDSTGPTDPIREQVTGGKGVQELRDLNVKYVIIRWWAFTPEQRAEMQAKLDALLGRPPDLNYPADQVSAWQLLP